MFAQSLRKGIVDPVQLFTASRLVIVAGKGGVGKTTVTAALALAAADRGLRCLVVEIDGKAQLASLFETAPLEPGKIVPLAADIQAVLITADAALLGYLGERGMGRLSDRLVRTGLLDVVATAAPGIDDLLVLGKVKQLERAAAADVILLDAPAAGHAITFLQSASGLLDAIGVGPINAQARDVTEMLADPSRTQVILVTLPEETPVNELVETAFALEEKIGVSLGPVVVNGIWDRLELPECGITGLDEAAAFRRHRVALQEEQIQRLTQLLPLPQVHLPFLFTSKLTLSDVRTLSAEFAS
ncbi:MAG: oxyanion-translocating ATPase [Acidimicrobiia bacterium]|nr:oxyanion-translocating ATPase [Acidimicrobiia bacterium]